MRSPLALVVAALLFGAPLCPRGALWPAALIALGALALAARFTLARKAGAALLLLVSAVAIGATMTGAKPALLPRTRRAIEAREVYGVLDQPCTTRGARQQCTVTEPDRTRVALYFTDSSCEARAGDAIRAIATVIPIQPTHNDGRLGPGASLVRAGILLRAESASCAVERRWPGPIDLVRRAGATLRAALDRGIARAFSQTDANRARALLFGDDDAIEPDTAEAFRNTGLSHLLAVSGAHVALVAASLAWVVRKLAARVRFIAERGMVTAVELGLAFPAVVLFVCATGEAPSAVRALVMATLAMVAKLRHRTSDGPSLLAASAALTLAAVPYWNEDVGWQLSIAASWALVSAHKAREQSPEETVDSPGNFQRLRAKARWLAQWTKDALVATARVALLTAPIVAAMSGRVALTGLLANVVAAPIGEVFSLPLVLAASLIAVVSPTLGAIVAKLASLSLAAMFAIPVHATRWPLASIECWPPTTGQTVAWLVIVGAALLAASPRKIALAIAFAAVVTGALEARHRAECCPRGVLRVTAIDVGQGDALLIDLPDGEAMLIDAGGVVVGSDPGERVVLPLLAARRRKRLAAVVASHPHPDHVNGLAAVLRWAKVDELWDTRQVEQWERSGWMHARSTAETQGVRVRGPESLCGRERYFHGATLEVLAPCRALRARESPNDASFVLRLSFGASSILLPGDLEAAGERALLSRVRPVTALKLGHHGSRTSSTDPWLDALRPQIAIASAGHPSPFDHPHAVVLERLRKRSIPVRSTSTHGMITLELFRDGRWESRDATGVVRPAP
ncbi:MAG: DNA internalization-related competence protein ComEC/Rec2 [Polyangiales bacterium]